MLQVWRELRASEQDYTFDHVVSTMEVQMAAHQARIEYPRSGKTWGSSEREGWQSSNSISSMPQSTSVRRFAMGDGSLPFRHQTYPNGIGGATPLQVIYVTVKGCDGDIQRASSFPPLVADLNINARCAHLFSSS